MKDQNLINIIKAQHKVVEQKSDDKYFKGKKDAYEWVIALLESFNNEGLPLTIELTKSQTKKFQDWQKLFGEPDGLPNIGMTGGHFGLEIIFTSIGLVIYGKSWKGDKINLTEE